MTTKKVASNTIYQLIGKLVSMSITVLATVIIARVYSREGYGEFSLMQGIPALFFIIVDFGLNAIAVKKLTNDFSQAGKYLGNILVLRIALSIMLMVFAGLAISAFDYSPELKLGIYLSLFLILTQALYATTNVIFQAKLKYDYSAIGYVLGSLVVLVLVLLFSYFKYSVMIVNFSYVIGGFVTFFVNYYFIKKFIDVKIDLTIDKALIKSLFIQSLPLGLMFVFSQINFRADVVLLSILDVPGFLGLSKIEAVAVYGLPYKIFEVALVVPTFFMNAMYPIYISKMTEGKEAFKATVTKSIKAMLLLGALATGTGILFSDFAVQVLGGSEFSQSSTTLRLLLVGLTVFYISQPLSWLIVALGGQKKLPKIYLLSAIFNLGLNILLIPVYSFYASAVITWLSELVILGLLLYAAREAWRQKYA